MDETLGRLPVEPVDDLTKSFKRFLHIEAMAGVVLLFCTIVALALSNSPWSTPYHSFWDMRAGFWLGDLEFSRSLKHWINDGWMTLFFFLVALELKREMVMGELRNWHTAAALFCRRSGRHGRPGQRVSPADAGRCRLAWLGHGDVDRHRLRDRLPRGSQLPHTAEFATLPALSGDLRRHRRDLGHRIRLRRSFELDGPCTGGIGSPPLSC